MRQNLFSEKKYTNKNQTTIFQIIMVLHLTYIFNYPPAIKNVSRKIK